MKIVYLILLSIFAFSCNKDESDSMTDSKAMKLVTGINFRQVPDDTNLQLGNPNILVENKFVIYPNPASQALNFSSKENISDVWIVPAIPEKIYQDTDFANILNIGLYNEESIASNSIVSLNGKSLNNLQVDIQKLEKGYYKVFVKVDEEIYWDNFYKCDTDFDKEQLSTLRNFWN